MRWPILLPLMLMFVCPAARAEDPLEALFRENSLVLEHRDGDLSGPALEFLLDETRDVRFFCIAEPHNTREIPRLVTGLFERLRRERDFRYLAIEQGPFVVRRIAELAAQADNEAVRKAMRKHRKALHFRTAAEVEMIADVARMSDGKVPAIWGLDRVLDSKFLERWLGSDDAADDPEVPFLREHLAWSEENLTMYRSKRKTAGPSPDEHREAGFKRALDHYLDRSTTDDDPSPRVMFRFGHTHMGRAQYRSYASLGRHLAETAATDDLRSFHLNLQAINEGGKYWSLTDYPEYEPLAAVGDANRWILVDLRPAREALRSGAIRIDGDLRRLVVNFDAVLMIGGLSKGRRL